MEIGSINMKISEFEESYVNPGHACTCNNENTHKAPRNITKRNSSASESKTSGTYLVSQRIKSSIKFEI
jgi:hypothetical protein